MSKLKNCPCKSWDSTGNIILAGDNQLVTS